MQDTLCLLPGLAFLAGVIGVLWLVAERAKHSGDKSSHAGRQGELSRNGPNSSVALHALPYRLRDDFASPAELSLYHLVVDVSPDDSLILAKVNLGDIFFVRDGSFAARMGWRSRIDRKHVDLLLCDRRTLRLRLGIELDDRSHARADRRQRDDFVDRVFGAAGLPLLRVPARMTYNVQELRASIEQALGVPFVPGAESRTSIASVATAASAPPAVAASGGEPPACPRCGVPMVRRTATRGPQAGAGFWGCPNYPRCRGTLPMGTSVSTSP